VQAITLAVRPWPAVVDSLPGLVRRAGEAATIDPALTTGVRIDLVPRSGPPGS